MEGFIEMHTLKRKKSLRYTPTYLILSVERVLLALEYTQTDRRVIPNQFSKHLHMTPSELDQTWYVCSTCGFMKPDKMLLTVIVWFPGYGPLKIQLIFYYTGYYLNPDNFPILDYFVK